MFTNRLVQTATSVMSRASFTSSAVSGKKVCVLGAAGGIGQPLSLLLKLSPEVTELSCYDIVGTPGVAADLAHIPTHSKVTGSLPAAGSFPSQGNTGLKEALTGASVVVIPAGVPRKPGMTRDDLFNTNAGEFEIMGDCRS
jgi:malate dehydrogenase